MWDMDKLSVSTKWVLVFVVSVLACIGYISGFAENEIGFSKSLKPFKWGFTQILSTLLLILCWLENVILSWRISNQVEVRIGAIFLCSLPQLLTQFFVFGGVVVKFN